MKLLGRCVFILSFTLLYTCSNMSNEEEVDSSFSEFLILFSNDEIFQKTRIFFPLEIESYSDDLEGIEKSYILKTDYD